MCVDVGEITLESSEMYGTAAQSAAKDGVRSTVEPNQLYAKRSTSHCLTANSKTDGSLFEHERTR